MPNLHEINMYITALIMPTYPAERFLFTIKTTLRNPDNAPIKDMIEMAVMVCKDSIIRINAPKKYIQ